MKWQDAMAYIESLEFDAHLNVVSSSRHFFRAVARDNVVLEIYRQLQESGELREEVLGRISDLARQEIDLNYENPNDTALATYLWLTCYTSPEYVDLASYYTACAPNCWYARKLAHRILAPPPSKDGNSVKAFGDSFKTHHSGTSTTRTFNSFHYGQWLAPLPPAFIRATRSDSSEYTVEALS